MEKEGEGEPRLLQECGVRPVVDVRTLLGDLCVESGPLAQCGIIPELLLLLQLLTGATGPRIGVLEQATS